MNPLMVGLTLTFLAIALGFVWDTPFPKRRPITLLIVIAVLMLQAAIAFAAAVQGGAS
jgi:RsiW-degrading membrane proteinase PrsW (M82 family)